MMSTNNEITVDLIEQLRSMTEEVDFNQFLKKTFRGYTKDSVLEYLSVLRKQQQTASDTFYKNLQLLFNEKEELQNSNIRLQAHLQKIENEYQNLSDAMQIYHPENEELTLSNMISLQNLLKNKEEELTKNHHENQMLSSKLEHSVKTITELSKKIDQSANQIDAQKEVQKTLKQEIKKNNFKITELSNQLEIEREENRFLKEKQSETQVFQLIEKINSITEQLSLHSELLAVKNDETMQKDNIIDALNDEIEMLKKNQNSLYTVLDEINAQNDRLILSNQAFTKVLEEEFIHSLTFIHEKSYLNRERIEALKKLDAAYSKINSLELQLEKSGKVIELNRINQQESKLKEEFVTEIR